jgi:radical SAM protein with 4Fe4S-binding SPASM domain
MSPDVFQRALSFVKRSHIPEARLLGGEPTEHPLFRDYVARALHQGLRVVVFSGGGVPEDLLDYLEGLPGERFLLVLNVADPTVHPPELVRQQKRVCQILGSKVRLGINFHKFQQNTSYLFDWVNRYRLQHAIRVGVAHPIWGGDNSFYHLRRQQPLDVVERLFEAAERSDIEVTLDCGFTPCMFSDAFVEAHPDCFQADLRPKKTGVEAARSKTSRLCGPVIDILPEGMCIACYALSRIMRLPLLDGLSRKDLLLRFEREIAALTPRGMYRECDRCSYRQASMCDGGCRARRALRFRPEPMPLTSVEFQSPQERNRP